MPQVLTNCSPLTTTNYLQVGPDFLDGMQHEVACGVPSYNLDGWMLGREGTQTRLLASGGHALAAVHLTQP